MSMTDEAQAAAVIDSVPVHIKSSEVALVTEVGDFVFTFVTLIVTTTAQQAIQADPTRETVMILPIDGPVVLTSSYAQGSNPANVVAGVPNPVGAYIPQGTGVSLDGTDTFWAVAPAQTRMSVITTRRRGN